MLWGQYADIHQMMTGGHSATQRDTARLFSNMAHLIGSFYGSAKSDFVDSLRELTTVSKLIWEYICISRHRCLCVPISTYVSCTLSAITFGEYVQVISHNKSFIKNFAFLAFRNIISFFQDKLFEAKYDITRQVMDVALKALYLSPYSLIKQRRIGFPRNNLL